MVAVKQSELLEIGLAVWRFMTLKSASKRLY